MMNVIYREKLQENFNIIIVYIVSEDDKAFKLLKNYSCCAHINDQTKWMDIWYMYFVRVHL